MFYQLLKPYIDDSIKRSFKRGDIIYHEGSSPQNIYLIDDGLVGLFHLAESGKETFLRVFGKDCIFGHRSFFAGTNYHATSIALKKTDVSIISKAQCDDICHGHPELMKEMLNLMAKDLGSAELRLAGIQDKTAKIRIIESMIYLKHKYPDQVWTRKEIAEYAASTMESVARVMTELNESGLLIKEGRDFEIPDTEKLLAESIQKSS